MINSNHQQSHHDVLLFKIKSIHYICKVGGDKLEKISEKRGKIGENGRGREGRKRKVVLEEIGEDCGLGVWYT